MLYTAYVVVFIASVCDVLSFQNDPPDIETSTDVMLRTAWKLCPYSNICSNYTNNNYEKTSCCSDCSCDASCTVKGDCCFPTEDNKTTLRNQREYQECIAPVTKEILPSEYTKYRFYYMTSSCPVNKDSNMSNDCGSDHVAPWGSLYPIYSKSTGKIYKNRACADCHGVRDGILWSAYMSCKILHKSKTFYISVDEYFERLSQNRFSEYCQVYFTFRHALDSEICFRDIIKTCNETEMVVSDITDMTKKEIVAGCNKGIAAPYQFHHTYANVFCFLCNGGSRFQAENCGIAKPGIFGPPLSLKTFTCLLDARVFKSVTRMNTKKDKHLPMACLNHNVENTVVDTCVDVLCPSGQLYDSDFNCFHPASTWRLPIYHIALRLKFDSLMLNVSTFMTLLQSGSDVSTWMYCPWPMRWAVNELYYELEIGNNRTKYIGGFIVFLKTRQNGKKHITMLREVEFFMTMTWKIKALQGDISLTQHFLEYSTLHFSWKLNQLVPVWYNILIRYKTTENTPFFRRNSIISIINPKEHLSVLGRINKMNFCKTISLGSNSSDYKIIADNALLNFNGSFFFDEEFEVITKIDGTLEPRICLDDSPFTERPFGLSSGSVTSSAWSSLLFTTIFMSLY